MATLSTAQRVEVCRDVMDLLSRHNVSVPVTKDDLQSLVNLIDGQMETAESNILGAIPDGVGKTWLTTNPSTSRRLIVMVAQARQEVL